MPTSSSPEFPWGAVVLAPPRGSGHRVFAVEKGRGERRDGMDFLPGGRYGQLPGWRAASEDSAAEQARAGQADTEQGETGRLGRPDGAVKLQVVDRETVSDIAVERDDRPGDRGAVVVELPLGEEHQRRQGQV